MYVRVTRFERATFRSQSGRSSQAELYPDTSFLYCLVRVLARARYRISPAPERDYPSKQKTPTCVK